MAAQRLVTSATDPRTPFGLPRLLWFTVFLAAGMAASLMADALFSDAVMAATFASSIVLTGALRLYHRSSVGGNPALPRGLSLYLAHSLGLGAIFLFCALVCWFVGEAAS